MIKHILLWRFQDAVREDPAQAQEILQKLADSVSHMNGQIPGLIHAEIGRNVLGGDWDFVFYSEFTDQASLDSYQNHPLHVAHKQMAAPYLAARLAADYQV